MEQTFEVTEINRLKQHPRNPRRSDISALVESIRVNGFYGTVIAQRSSGYILAGNHRVEAALQCGYDEIPVAWVDVDDQAALRILLVDNRSSDTAFYDNTLLANLLKELQEGDVGLEGTGFSDDNLDELERVAGLLARERSSFLDDLLVGDSGPPAHTEEDQPGLRDRARLGDVQTPASTEFYSLSYMYLLEDRQFLVKTLTRIRKEHDYETASEALLHIVKDWAERNPDGEAAEK